MNPSQLRASQGRYWSRPMCHLTKMEACSWYLAADQDLGRKPEEAVADDVMMP